MGASQSLVTHMFCWTWAMRFSAAASSENDQGSMNSASNTVPVPSTTPSSVAAIQRGAARTGGCGDVAFRQAIKPVGCRQRRCRSRDRSDSSPGFSQLLARRLHSDFRKRLAVNRGRIIWDEPNTLASRSS
jgi:hypothetical protein